MTAFWQDESVRARFVKYAWPTEGCWLWAGSLKTGERGGYGQLQIQRRGVRKWYRAHVLSWEIANRRDWPSGALARHTCDNPRCVNPAHIIPGTHADNMADKAARGRLGGPPSENLKKTHCPQGHAYAGDNLRIAPNGQRVCRACVRERSLAHYHKKQGVLA